MYQCTLFNKSFKKINVYLVFSQREKGIFDVGHVYHVGLYSFRFLRLTMINLSYMIEYKWGENKIIILTFLKAAGWSLYFQLRLRRISFELNCKRIMCKYLFQLTPVTCIIIEFKEIFFYIKYILCISFPEFVLLNHLNTCSYVAHCTSFYLGVHSCA